MRHTTSPRTNKSGEPHAPRVRRDYGLDGTRRVTQGKDVRATDERTIVAPPTGVGTDQSTNGAGSGGVTRQQEDGTAGTKRHSQEMR